MIQKFGEFCCIHQDNRIKKTLREIHLEIYRNLIPSIPIYREVTYDNLSVSGIIQVGEIKFSTELKQGYKYIEYWTKENSYLNPSSSKKRYHKLHNPEITLEEFFMSLNTDYTKEPVKHLIIPEIVSPCDSAGWYVTQKTNIKDHNLVLKINNSEYATLYLAIKESTTFGLIKYANVNIITKEKNIIMAYPDIKGKIIKSLPNLSTKDVLARIWEIMTNENILLNLGKEMRDMIYPEKKT